MILCNPLKSAAATAVEAAPTYYFANQIAKMTQQFEIIANPESDTQLVDSVTVVGGGSSLNAIDSLAYETAGEPRRRPVNIARRMMIARALRTESPEKGNKWKDINAADIESGEFSATLLHILEDYSSCSDFVDQKSALSLQSVEMSFRKLGGKAYERIHEKLRVITQTNPICEYSAENIPEFKAPKLSARILTPEPQINSTRRSLKDVKVLREENWGKALWKASAERPSSAFERKLKRLTAVGSDNLPPPIQIETAKEVSRWPSSSTSHHSQYGPNCASRQTLSLREKLPNASKVANDVVMPKDRSNLYNEVRDLLLTRLQGLPEDAALTSSGYIAIFLDALELLSNSLTTYKPLLQAIISEIKSVFDVQNQCRSTNLFFC